MGKKTAERLVVELKSKIKKTSSGAAGGEKIGDALSEVIDGLAAMGYSKDEAKAAAHALDPKEKSTEQLLREALRSLSR
jgi:Holliday junction DNA helicase RuvA